MLGNNSSFSATTFDTNLSMHAAFGKAISGGIQVCLTSVCLLLGCDGCSFLCACFGNGAPLGCGLALLLTLLRCACFARCHGDLRGYVCPFSTRSPPSWLILMHTLSTSVRHNPAGLPIHCPMRWSQCTSERALYKTTNRAHMRHACMETIAATRQFLPLQAHHRLQASP